MDALNFYNTTFTEISAAVAVFVILLTFLIALGIVWVYKYTHRGLSYSQSFLTTLIMVAVLGSIVMMVVQENLVGAFALLGAFSLIRFRTIVKDTKDVAFVFFSLVEGVAVGTSNYAVALIGFVMVSGIILFINRIWFGASVAGGHIVLLHADGGVSSEALGRILGEWAETHHVLHIQSADGKLEYSFAVRLHPDRDPDGFIRALRDVQGVISVDLMSGKESVEY